MNDLTTETLRRLLKETQARIAELERELANGWQARSLANAQVADDWRNEAAQLSDKLAELEKERDAAVKAHESTLSKQNGLGEQFREIESRLAAAQSSLSVATKDAEENSRLLVEARAEVAKIDAILPEHIAQEGTHTSHRVAMLLAGNETLRSQLAAAESRATTAELLAERYRAALETIVEHRPVEYEQKHLLRFSSIAGETAQAALAAEHTSPAAPAASNEQIAGAENAAAEGVVWGGAEL